MKTVEQRSPVQRDEIYAPMCSQWRRSVIKNGGQGQWGQGIKLFHITLYVNNFQTLNNPGSWQPVGAWKN